MRRIPVPLAPLALLALLAAPPLLAQKPGAGDDPRERWRGQGVSICVAEMNALEGVTPDDSEAACGCAFDRFMPRWPTGALPPLGRGRLPPAIASELVACAAGQDAAFAAAVARHLAAAPAIVAAGPPVPDEGGKPPADADADADAAPQRPAFDFRAWVDSFAWPRWMTGSGLPLWAWVPLIVFVFLFLRGLMRRRDGKDLMGPPRSLDPTTRRPDLPPPRL
jgi:hypothetical protein